jgi:hypothetical protein
MKHTEQQEVPTALHPELPRPEYLTVKRQFLADMTVKYIATPIAATLPAGTPPPTWLSSDPALALSDDPGDTSGLTKIGKGTALAAGVTVAVVVAPPHDVAEKIPFASQVTAAPVNIVAGPVDSGHQFQVVDATAEAPTGEAVGLSSHSRHEKSRHE